MVIDQGGHATRAMVFDETGMTVCHAVAEIETFTDQSLVVEHDPGQLMDSVYSVIDQVYEYLGEDYFKIHRAGMATQRSSIVCWDKISGQALSPVISWQDRRTTSQLKCSGKQNEFIHELTGLYLNPHYGATKIKWCLDNIPSVKTSLAAGKLCIAPMSSYILFQLLEEHPLVTDPANASRTLLMNYKTLAWEESLLKTFSVPEKILPEIVYTHSVYGNIIRHSHSIPLLLCTGDQSAVIYSQGELDNNEVFINAGTGAFIQKPVSQMPDLKHQRLLTSVVYADNKKISYVVEGTVNGAGRALQWFAEQSKIPDYENKLDLWCKQYVNPPIFLNAISGIGSPYWIAEQESYFLSEATDEEKFVAVLESIIFLIIENIRCMQNVSGNITQIRIAGGLANNTGFCQKLSDLSNCNVLSAEDSEATAKGVFFLLSHHSRKASVYSAMFHPKNDEMLFNRYHLWRKLMCEKISG